MNEEASSAMTFLSSDMTEMGSTSATDIFAKLMAAFAAYSVVSIIVSLVLFVLTIIATWKMFKKAGEKGWKSLIPIYNVYIFTRIAWSGALFPIFLILSFAGSFAAKFFGGLVGIIIAMILFVSLIIFYFMLLHKLSKRFGHGVLFTLGLIFFYPFFIMILGFGKSNYDFNRAIS